MDREDDAGLHCLSFKPLFECGTAIRVIEGALAGIEGIFEREDANDRVVVLLNLLGRETLINLPAASVMPAGSSY
jgi:transcription antitermination factor NusG